VQNDRAGEVGRTLNVKDFDLERIFGQEGVQIVHLSGLVAALSPDTSTFCLEIARFAKKYGTLISFDLNYRATFWKGRENELKQVFNEIASLSDILIGNEEDFQLCLGIEGPKAGGEGIESAMDAFKGMIINAKKAYPNVSVFANTLREVVSVNEHLWGAIVYENGNWHVVNPKPIVVMDRIGGGDGFVGGLLYAILKDMPSEKWIQFAWASGALATTFLTDYAQPSDEDMIWSIWEGNARVKR
jgi:2-dehydro-3-deoxygluconokinase